jgi:Cu-processing system permease protein
VSVLWTLAMKEFRDGLRNRWVAATVLLLGGLALALSLVGTAPAGAVRASALETAVISLSSLSVYLLPLMALMLAFDALVGELERGTMALLLTYPVQRWQVVIGKFLGHSLILATAILLGYGGAALASVAGADFDVTGWAAYAAMMGSSLLLGMAFVALAYLVSALTRERATAAGMAVGLWMLFVVIYDLLLLGVLLLDQQHWISPGSFSVLLLASPADVYRILNLAAYGDIARLTGVSGVSAAAGSNVTVLLLILTAWVLLPLLATVRLFQRREL